MKYVYVLAGAVLCTGEFACIGQAEDYFDDRADNGELPDGGVTMLESEYMMDQQMFFDVGVA